MSRTSGLVLLLAALAVLLVIVLQLTAEPGPTRPEVLPGGTATRKVFDLLTPPREMAVIIGGATHSLPDQPRRLLVAELADGALLLGWTADPALPPAATLRLPVPGQLLEAYVDLHQDGRAVVEIWAGYTPEAGRRVIELRFAMP